MLFETKRFTIKNTKKSMPQYLKTIHRENAKVNTNITNNLLLHDK